MKIELSFYTSLCGPKSFTINGINSNYEDFGVYKDFNPGNAPEYGCGDRRFDPYVDATNVILKKYQITKEEYYEVCQELKDKLHFGMCSLCR